MMITFEKRCTEMMQSFEQRVHQTKNAPKNNQEYTEFKISPPNTPRVTKNFKNTLFKWSRSGLVSGIHLN